MSDRESKNLIARPNDHSLQLKEKEPSHNQNKSEKTKHEGTIN